VIFFFFFQAEDGIRDYKVTGVQTCALPISAGPEKVGRDFYERSLRQREQGGAPLEKGAALATFLASADSDGITGRLFSAVWDDWAKLPERREHLAKSDI